MNASSHLKGSLLAEALNLNDRVVYVTQHGAAEVGSVRWIGKLPENGNALRTWVGVEFDNPVGQDSAWSDGKILFTARPERAGLVRIEELVKSEDFFCLTETNDPGIGPDAVYGSDCDSINVGFRGNGSSDLISFLSCSGLESSGEDSGQQSRVSAPAASRCGTGVAKCSVKAGGMRKDGKSPVEEHPRVRTGILRRNATLPSQNEDVGASTADMSLPDSPEQSLLPATLPCGATRHGDIMEVGSLVEVFGWFKDVFYGVIRWIGYIDDQDLEGQLMTGLEMEEEDERFSDGVFNGKRYFYCGPQRALFLPLAKCQRDRRFSSSSSPRPSTSLNLEADCVVPGIVAPCQTSDRLCGPYRGIQGHLNSCYLDATLFAMFTYSCVFDSVLYRPPKACDIEEYSELQAILREEIVNPLRKFCYVKANHVMRLRCLLDRCSRVEGLVSEEKDPEEFLQSLLSDTLRAEPLIHLSTGQEAFMYQLVVEKDERLALPTVQQLFDQSFLSSSLKFKEVPPCLIIQMPRCGPSFKMYARIQPSMALDVTDALLDAPRSCHVCGALAEVECVDCYDVQEGLESTAYCRPCLNKVHSHRKRVDHESRVLIVSQEARDYFVPSRVRGYANGCVAPPTPPRVLMELFAVVCIQTSHYVAFVKAGSGAEAPWCFFDSMADRSEDNGYNIPEVVGCPGLHRWLSEERIHEILSVKDEKLLPEHARRLLCDAYLCFYQSHDTLMYR